MLKLLDHEEYREYDCSEHNLSFGDEEMYDFTVRTGRDIGWYLLGKPYKLSRKRSFIFRNDKVKKPVFPINVDATYQSVRVCESFSDMRIAVIVGGGTSDVVKPVDNMRANQMPSKYRAYGRIFSKYEGALELVLLIQEDGPQVIDSITDLFPSSSDLHNAIVEMIKAGLIKSYGDILDLSPDGKRLLDNVSAAYS